MPNKLDTSQLTTVRVQNAIDKCGMSVKSARVATKRIDQSSDGRVTFGEIAFLIRGGVSGILPSRDAELLTNSLQEEDETMKMADLIASSSDSQICDDLRLAFQKKDENKDGLISWQDLNGVIEEFGNRQGLLAINIAAVVESTPSKPPVATQQELDFEDWYDNSFQSLSLVNLIFCLL